jgi:hypothetical protein
VVQELNERSAKNEAEINPTMGQLREMKISFTRRVRLFFMNRG